MEEDMIRITSKRHDFRRCGMPHPKGPVDYPNDRFTKEELEILENEPMLTVERVDKSGKPAGNKTMEVIKTIMGGKKPEPEKVKTVGSPAISKAGKPATKTGG